MEGSCRGSRAYHVDPAGAVIEHDTDMEQMLDDGAPRGGRWALDDLRWLSQWADAPDIDVTSLGLPPSADVRASER